MKKLAAILILHSFICKLMLLLPLAQQSNFDMDCSSSLKDWSFVTGYIGFVNVLAMVKMSNGLRLLGCWEYSLNVPKWRLEAKEIPASCNKLCIAQHKDMFFIIILLGLQSSYWKTQNTIGVFLIDLYIFPTWDSTQHMLCVY